MPPRDRRSPPPRRSSPSRAAPPAVAAERRPASTVRPRPAVPPAPHAAQPAVAPAPPAFASRGGDKLEAALQAFALGPRVASGNALDVGASHGGFTDCLLRHGARHVTAIDVGHGQLRPALLADPRVTSLENAHFKTLPLRIAPGPFDFFTLDVSFCSARVMLRGIALRLAPGAHGVVLVKPQFELPKALVPAGGVVASRPLRRFALARFRKRAEKVGFAVRGHIESPVEGAAGNREWLVHLELVTRPLLGSVPPIAE